MCDISEIEFYIWYFMQETRIASYEIATYQ